MTPEEFVLWLRHHLEAGGRDIAAIWDNLDLVEMGEDDLEDLRREYGDKL